MRGTVSPFPKAGAERRSFCSLLAVVAYLVVLDTLLRKTLLKRNLKTNV
jgi:hypothetical protein